MEILLLGVSGGSSSTGNTNTFIGYLTNAVVGVNPTNSTAIGYGAFTEKSNEIALGNYDITEIRSATNGLCNLGSSAFKFNNLYIAGNVIGLAKNSINPTNAGDRDLYDDGTLRVWLDDSTSDDIEIEITTAPENITASKTYYLTSTSYKTTTTASGAIALAGTATVNYTVDFDFQSDEIMYIRIWSPTIGTSWGLYEITCINTNATDFTGHPVMCSVKRV
jgi:hypothetical protein